MFVCFHCEKEYYKSDSLAANTHEQYAETYCSRVCEDKDLEAMQADAQKANQEMVDFVSNATKAAEQDTNTQSVGGFTLKVKKEN